MASTTLPPGTYRIEDLKGTHLVLAPQPNSDPNQPLNWSRKRKSLHMVLLCIYGLMVFAILCASQPYWATFNAELGISYETMNHGYAANTATLAIGCNFLIPIALRYGRRPMYILSVITLLGIAIWQAVFKTGSEIIAFSVLCGIPGALNEALFQVTISDLFFVHQRGTMNGIFLVAVSSGVFLSPVASGYLAQAMNWRWTFWICSIITGVLIIVMLSAFEETKYEKPVIPGVAVQEDEDSNIASRVNSITKESLGRNETNITNKSEPLEERKRLVPIDTSIPMNSYAKRHGLWFRESNCGGQERRSIWKQAYIPFAILVQFPAVTLAAVVYGFCQAVLSITTIVQTTLYPFPPYEMTTIGVGNMNIAPMVGIFIGTLFGGPLTDWAIVQIAKRRGGIYEPETRLWLFPIPLMVLTAGVLMFGLTISKGLPWPINAVGAGFIGFGLGGAGDIVLTYVQDCYQHILGDALTGVVFVRNTITTILVFAITPWVAGMGFYNMFVLLGCLSALVTLSFIPFVIWGKKWRIQRAAKYEYYAARRF